MRKRILQIFNRYLQYGGEEGSIYRIGDAMQEDFDVEYFLGSSKEMLDGGFSKKIKSALFAFSNPEATRRLARYQKIGQFDAWQIHNVFPTLSPAVYAKGFELNIPIVHYLHNYRISCVNGFFINHGTPCELCINGNFASALKTACWKDSHLLSGYMGAILTRARQMGLLEKVTAWIALSERQKEIHVRMGIPEQRIHVIPHYLDLKECAESANGSSSALFIGRLSPEKGVMQLLESWKHLRDSSQKLFIVGEGPEREKLENFASTSGLNVRFFGFLSQREQCQIWKEINFVIVPSIWEEPFGMVVLEAWAKRKAVLSSQLGALPELVSHGKTGLSANIFDPVAFAEKIDFLFRHPLLSRAMGAAGYEEVRSTYNRENWRSNINALYKKILP